jgi:hypothetical protein
MDIDDMFAALGGRFDAAEVGRRWCAGCITQW